MSSFDDYMSSSDDSDMSSSDYYTPSLPWFPKDYIQCNICKATFSSEKASSKHRTSIRRWTKKINPNLILFLLAKKYDNKSLIYQLPKNIIDLIMFFLADHIYIPVLETDLSPCIKNLMERYSKTIQRYSKTIQPRSSKTIEEPKRKFCILQ